MKKTFEELNAMKFDIVEHFGMQKKSEFFIMNTVAPAEYGADADYQYYEVDVKTDEDLDALKAFIEDLFGMKVYATTIKQAIKEIEVSPVVLELSEQLMAFMKGHTPFTNPQYSLQNVLTDIGTNEHRFNKVLRYNGFSGFRDYINFNRLQYFKEQAALRKELTVKELMFMSGFTSRSSFYRYFASIEKMSPSEYMERLQQEG